MSVSYYAFLVYAIPISKEEIWEEILLPPGCPNGHEQSTPLPNYCPICGQKIAQLECRTERKEIRLLYDDDNMREFDDRILVRSINAQSDSETKDENEKLGLGVVLQTVSNWSDKRKSRPLTEELKQRVREAARSVGIPDSRRGSLYLCLYCSC
jgi:hypothetical protein